MPGVKGQRKTAPTVNARHRIWTAMRIQRRFIIPDLMGAAEARRHNVAKFVRGLLANGYLRIDAPKLNGKRGGHVIYALIRNTGPFPPRIHDDGTVFDPNLRAPW